MYKISQVLLQREVFELRLHNSYKNVLKQHHCVINVSTDLTFFDLLCLHNVEGLHNDMTILHWISLRIWLAAGVIERK